MDYLDSGNGFKGSSGDGLYAIDARLHHPYGVAVGTVFNFHIASTLNN